MRGIFSVLFSREQDSATFNTGIVVLSCSDKLGEQIARKAMEWMPHVRWTIVKRFEPGFAWFNGEMLFSSYADTLARQWSFVRSLRSRKFDIVLLACTNERSFNSLKVMGILSGYRSLGIFNENIDAYIACRTNLGIVKNHFRWRLRQKRVFSGKNIFLATLSWIFLFPAAIVYILFRTACLVLLKKIRGL